MRSDASSLRIGFIPLIDCAPLVVARELGFFEREGLSVQLSREASWANIRDKLCVGELQAAHMLAPMPLATSLGLNGIATPLVTALSLNLNGNGVTVSAALHDRLRQVDEGFASSAERSVRVLKRLVDERRREGLAPLVFAMVYPYSCHNYLLRYWLATGGIDPNEDVNLIVIPPARMVSQLAAGRIDGLCVGEPWNQLAQTEGHGTTLFATRSIWQNAPEKVLAVRADWAERNAGAHRQLLRALLRAAAWLAEEGDGGAAAELLGRPEYLALPPALIEAGRRGGGHVFHRYCANFPWLSHAIWLMAQMVRWGQMRPSVDARRLAGSVYRPDIYRAVCASLSMPCPDVDSKPEGMHDAEWRLGGLTIGPDRFIDGARFDPQQPL